MQETRYPDNTNVALWQPPSTMLRMVPLPHFVGEDPGVEDLKYVMPRRLS